MAGTHNDEVVDEILAYAQDTQHEKVSRACAVALALMQFQRAEESDELTAMMLASPNEVIRYGGAVAVALAHCGRGGSQATRTLLRLAATDVCDDVRRQSVVGLAFVLSSEPTRLPALVKLQASSHNLHLRAGAALCLGIGLSGSASIEALDIARPLLKDPADLVRQSAHIAIGLLLMQQKGMHPDKLAEIVKAETEAAEKAEKARPEVSAQKSPSTKKEDEPLKPDGVPRLVTEHRQSVLKLVGARQDPIVKFGALVALGLMEGGGRNAAISLAAERGVTRQSAVLGMALFSQMFYWFPLVLCGSICMQPTAVVGLTHQLDMPKHFAARCEAWEDFEYPAAVTQAKAEKASMKKLELTSAAAKKMRDVKGKEAAAQAGNDMDEEAAGKAEAEAAVQKEKDEAEARAQKAILRNPFRVLPQQEISFLTAADAAEPARYTPLFPERRSGVVILVDSRPDEAEELVEVDSMGVEPEPPAPFRWTEEEDDVPVAAASEEAGEKKEEEKRKDGDKKDAGEAGEDEPLIRRVD